MAALSPSGWPPKEAKFCEFTIIIKYKAHNFQCKDNNSYLPPCFPTVIEDVNCCGDAPIASLAQLSSNVES